MRYLVAGGAGFIGSNLCARLLDDDHAVICVDNLVTGRARNIEPLLSNSLFKFIEKDIVQPLDDLPDIAGIFHLASPASPPGYQRYAVETMRSNSEGTLHLLNLAVAKRARFLYASTSEAYGDPLIHPQTEDYRGNVNSTGPRSMYDESKRYGEALTALYQRTRGADTRIVRIFNTYGPCSDPMDGRLVPNFVTQALQGRPMTIYANGSQTRSLCFVSDLVEGLTRVMASSHACGNVINLGNPEEHSVLEFAEIIRELCQSSSEFVYSPPEVGDDPQRRCPDISRAKALLQWEPSVSLREGILATIEYFIKELGLGGSINDD